MSAQKSLNARKFEIFQQLDAVMVTNDYFAERSYDEDQDPPSNLIQYTIDFTLIDPSILVLSEYQFCGNGNSETEAKENCLVRAVESIERKMRHNTKFHVLVDMMLNGTITDMKITDKYTFTFTHLGQQKTYTCTKMSTHRYKQVINDVILV